MKTHTCLCHHENKSFADSAAEHALRKLGSHAGWISKFIQSALHGSSCGHESAEDPIPRLTARSAPKRTRLLQLKETLWGKKKTSDMRLGSMVATGINGGGGPGLRPTQYRS